jgi:hypothetical protein
VFATCYSRKTAAASLTTALIAIFAVGLYAPQPAAANETVRACSPFGNSVFQHAAVFGINTGQICPSPAVGGGGIQIWTAGNTVAAGQRATWQANAPAGLMIVGASVPNQSLLSTGVNDGEGYGGGFYWAGGGAQTNDGESGVGFGPFWSSYFGFQLVCGANPCRSGTSQLDVGEADLYVQETIGPALVAPDGLWQSSGWIRGDWNLHFWGDSPSGLCAVSATIAGQSVASAGSGQNPSVWHQCNAPAITQTIHTGQNGSGATQLTLGAWDAAGVPVSYTKTIYIDNSPPTIALSGPTEAPSIAGTQYVTAAASAGPSGVDGISCSADGAPYQWYPKATVQVPVAGVGVHRVTCFSANNARDASGNVATSAPQTWTLSVREPTVSGIGFGKLVDALRCKRITKRVRVPAHWVTVRRHHRHVRVRKRARTKLERVTRCHPRIVRRRITVWKTVIRHGKKVRVERHKSVRVVLLPHVVMHTSKWVGHGKRTVVSGWLGMPDGTALGGQVVQVLTAPDNGLGQFSQAAVATTAANGSWSARLSAGPSRLVEASYGGASVLEPSVSAQVHVVVPAKVKLLRVSPSRVAWSGTVRITGQLLGGYLPATGALVRLRIGQGSTYQTYGVQEHVTGNGRFTTTYQFGAGDPAVYRSFWFQIATLPIGDYPYAPAASGSRSVVVGGHPPPPPRRHRRRKHGKHR